MFSFKFVYDLVVIFVIINFQGKKTYSMVADKENVAIGASAVEGETTSKKAAKKQAKEALKSAKV